MLENHNILNYQFAKPLVKQSELCNLFCISNSTLKLWMKTWEDNGGELADIGYMPLEGVRENTWDAMKFLNFVITHKQKKPEKYSSKVEYKPRLAVLNNNKELKTNVN